MHARELTPESCMLEDTASIDLGRADDLDSRTSRLFGLRARSLDQLAIGR